MLRHFTRSTPPSQAVTNTKITEPDRGYDAEIPARRESHPRISIGGRILLSNRVYWSHQKWQEQLGAQLECYSKYKGNETRASHRLPSCLCTCAASERAAILASSEEREDE